MLCHVNAFDRNLCWWGRQQRNASEQYLMPISDAAGV
jgi:hypothetical protein